MNFLLSTKAIFLKFGFGLLLLYLLIFLNSCGATYPTNDVFNELYPGENSYYYLTNARYQLVNGSPAVESSTTANRLLLVVSQRDDIYYPKGVGFNFKIFDSRLLLQVDNLTTNYLIFSNTSFPSDINMHYYDLGGQVINFTNGYLMMTQAGPSSNWLVNLSVTNQGISRIYESEHARGQLTEGHFSPAQ